MGGGYKMVLGAIAAALGTGLNFAIESFKYISKQIKDFSVFITTNFPFDKPLKLLLLSFFLLAAILGIFITFGGHGIGGAEWGDGSKAIRIGVDGGALSDGTGLLEGCVPGTVGDVDCDGIPDGEDDDRDGDGIPNEGDTTPDGGREEDDDDDDDGMGSPSTTLQAAGLVCGNGVCQEYVIPLRYYFTGPVSWNDIDNAEDQVVFCGVPLACVRNQRTDKDYTDPLCEFSGNDAGGRTVIVGKNSLFKNFNEFCSLEGEMVVEHTLESGYFLVINYTLKYIEDDYNCKGDCPETPSGRSSMSHCVDGIMDQGEEGVDCGGSCERDCGCFTHEDCGDGRLDFLLWNDVGAGYCSKVLEENPYTRIIGYFGHCCSGATKYGNHCVNRLPVFHPSSTPDLRVYLDFCNKTCTKIDKDDCLGEYVAYVEDTNIDDSGGIIRWLTPSPFGRQTFEEECAIGHVYDHDVHPPISVDPSDEEEEGDNQIIFNFLG